MMSETALHNSEANHHHYHKSRTESQNDMQLLLNDSNSFKNSKHNLNCMDDDDDMLFLTPTLDGGQANNQNLS